jgi:hypothetical protein
LDEPSAAQFKFGITQDFEWKLEALAHLPLILGRLGAEAVHFGLKVR